ncbi:MAG: FKBP-type peptidyl-prolyl cis-trans isomerase [Candidatus Thorarchaeota archaeon]
MSLLTTRIATIALLALFVSSSVIATVPITGEWDSDSTAHNVQQANSLAESSLNVSIPYVDTHYGSADGIIDPTEYAFNYTDSASGVDVYLEHNSTFLYVGLSAATSGWIAIGWQNYTDNFSTAGLNNSDLIFGYAPGTPHVDYPVVTGDEPVTVHYILKVRNGTIIQEGDFPNDDSQTPFKDEGLLQAYKDAIIGMRVGEVRHFIIPAEEAYTDPANDLYGHELEYIVTVTRIESDFSNAADASEIVYSDEHGTSTFQHLPDDNQSRIISADASDDGTVTQVEYVIRMNSTDSDDIPLFNATDLRYPLVVMFGANEDISELPVQHTDWSNPVLAELTPNAMPTLIVESPSQDETLEWVATLELNASDDGWIRRAYYKFDSENWTEIFHNFETSLWESSLDLADYESGAHTIWFNATDASNSSSVVFVNITIDWPFVPLLGMKLEVIRTISTQLSHGTTVEDAYTVLNNGSAPISAFEVLLPNSLMPFLLSFSAVDANDREIGMVQLEAYNDYGRWRVHFFEPVGFQETYQVLVSMSFHSLHTIYDFERDEFEIAFQKHPVVPYVLAQSQLILSFRSGDTILGNSPEGVSYNIAPLNNETVTLRMRSYTPLIIANRETTISIDPWGWLSYREKIHVENIGLSREYSLEFIVPEGSTTIRIYDGVGILAGSQPIETWELNETVSIDVDLQNDRFGDEGLLPGYEYTFYIDYTIQMSSYQVAVEAGNQLELPIGTLGNILVLSHTVDVVLPSSIGVVEAGGEYRLLYGVFDATLRYTIYNTTQENPPSITLVYQTSLTAAARPLLFSLIVGIVAGVYVLRRKVEVLEEGSGQREGETEAITTSRQTGAPPEQLREFANVYSKKTALNLDLEKLEAARRRGKVKKREFMIRERDIKSQLETIDSSLPALKDGLFQHGPKYRDMIAQLELQDEKIEGAKAGLRQLLLRKKKQRISRAAFEKSRQDYLKTIKRATSATDRILLSIQEEAGDL